MPSAPKRLDDFEFKKKRIKYMKRNRKEIQSSRWQESDRTASIPHTPSLLVPCFLSVFHTAARSGISIGMERVAENMPAKQVSSGFNQCDRAIFGGRWKKGGAMTTDRTT